MKLKDLEAHLQDVEGFAKPKQRYEQYVTGPHLTALILHAIAEDFEDMESNVFMDLGCGTGMLSIAAAILGAPHVIGLDIDEDALDQAHANLATFEDMPVDLVQADVARVPEDGALRNSADVVLMNPPFGSWCKGADSQFLRAAFHVSRRTVYSLHKRSTRAHIQKLTEQQLGAPAARVIAELAYDLPATYKHHKKASQDIEVDLWRFEVP